MDKDRALKKVLACLRLSKSQNVNEAAAALRQAQKLMSEYGLSEAEVATAEYRYFAAPTRHRGAIPPIYINWLANRIASGFRCRSLYNRATGNFYFVGTHLDAQVACYSFTVMRRRLDTDKAKHTARIRKRANKIARGDAFAVGWVSAVLQLFPALDLLDDQRAALELVVNNKFGRYEKMEGRKLATSKAAGENDRLRGYVAGKDVEYQPGITGAGQAALEQLR